MTKYLQFKQFIKQFFGSIKNQKLTVITTALSTLFGILAIFDAFNLEKHIFEYLSETFLCGTIVTLPLNIFTNKLKNWLKYLIQSLVTAGFCLIFYLLISNPSDYNIMYCLGLVFFFATLTIFLFIPKEKSPSYFANLIKHFLFCELLSSVLFFGLLLLLSAFNSLFFNFDNFNDILSSIGLFCYIFFFVNLFTFYLFEKRSEPSGKAFKIIFLYALLPVYAVLLVVLYSYLVKALILFTLPQGQLNWYVSFATVFYIVFWFILREYKDNKFVGYFYRYGALILLPLICVQIPAYIIRVNAYGFTGWRYSSLLYTIFATLTIISTFIKKAKYTDYAILVLGVFILFGSLTPFNLIDSAYNSQYKRMEKILTKYEMLKEDELNDELNIENSSEIEKIITDEERQQLYSSFNYISKKSEHKHPVWLNDKKSSFTNTFGINSPNSNNNIYYHSSYSLSKESLNISNYSSIKDISSHLYSSNGPAPEMKITLSNYSSIDIGNYILSLKEKDKFFFYSVNEQITLCFYAIEYSFDKEKNQFIYYSISAYELMR